MTKKTSKAPVQPAAPTFLLWSVTCRLDAPVGMTDAEAIEVSEVLDDLDGEIESFVRAFIAGHAKLRTRSLKLSVR